MSMATARVCPSPEPAAGHRGCAAPSQFGELGSKGAGCHPAGRPCPELTLLSAAPQLPVVSVVRDAESQLLPDVGAVVTCKVGRWSALRSMADLTAFAFSALC